MGFWAKSLRIFNCLCANATQSIRHLAQQTGLSKSSVHRLQHAMERRNSHPASWLWETEEGRQWWTRLVVAALYTFGLKRGVGLDTMSEFFARLHLDTQGGCSPSALRHVMQVWETSTGETAETWERDATATGEGREIIGGVDETFLERMLVVFQDLPTGYLVLEDVADDRTFATWHPLVEARLKVLGTEVLYLVSDRAKALIQLAEKGLECLSMPDFFHFVREIVQSYGLARGRRLRQAHKDLKHAEAVLERHRAYPPVESASPAAKAQVAARQAEGTRWEAVQRASRPHLETLSLSLHPLSIGDSAPQTSAQVESRLQAEVEALEVLASRHQLLTPHNPMAKVRKQVPALAALVDFWWRGVQQDLEPFALSPRWRQWVHEGLLPMVYGERQRARTRCRRRKATVQEAWEKVRAAFDQHAITQRLAPQLLAEWHAWATDRGNAFQRASSSVEGRNGSLSQMHHNQRGLPKRRYKVWTVLHNCDCRAADGTTPAARFFSRSFPDLFETVLSHIDELPRPRRRNQAVA
jgi:Family of unknown function (DUF6399)/IclR helix-turn-helix domain